MRTGCPRRLGAHNRQNPYQGHAIPVLSLPSVPSVPSVSTRMRSFKAQVSRRRPVAGMVATALIFGSVFGAAQAPVVRAETSPTHVNPAVTSMSHAALTKGLSSDTAGADATTAAAPTVVGYGAGTTGGTGGKVYSVSNWSQLKTALQASGPRIVRLTGSADFNGGGERITVSNGNLTIDGSGWSGTLRRYSIVIEGSNVIITQLRLRPSDKIDDVSEGDPLTINPGVGRKSSRIVIDRSSLLWGSDVSLALLNNVSDVTVQHSIIGAGLRYSDNPQSPKGYGPNVTTVGRNPNPDSEYGRRITFYRNYVLHNNQRNMRAHGTAGIEWVNNVYYNWGADLAHMNPRGANVVGNMFKKGPNTPSSNRVLRFETNSTYRSYFKGSTYWADNIGLGFNATTSFPTGVRRSSHWGGGLHNVTAAAPSATLAASVVAAAGPSLVDEIDQILKNNFTKGTGSFYNGAGYPKPNPTY